MQAAVIVQKLNKLCVYMFKTQEKKKEIFMESTQKTQKNIIESTDI